MNGPSDLPPERPKAPDPLTAKAAEEFQQMVLDSLPLVRRTAEKWVTGATALLGLTTSALIIKGPESAAEMAVPWRVLVTLLVGAGLASAIAGIWRALSVSTGTPTTFSVSELASEYGSPQTYRISIAKEESGRLATAKRWLMAALVLLVAGSLAWWWSAPPPSTAAYVTVVETSGAQTCGKLLTSWQDGVQLDVDGLQGTLWIPMAAVQRISPMDGPCP